MLRIAKYTLTNPLVLAPMAGVTDRPFRQLCKMLGAGHVVSEMAASNPALWATEKSMRRLNHDGEQTPIAVQLVGADPDMLAHAAHYNIERGAQIIDINMGCPAKKVCAQASGSALLRDEKKVAAILKAVHTACAAHGVPVTLKYRTGWCPSSNNALSIAHMAQDLGIALLTLHGRSRACGFVASAEYDTIARVKQAVGIPVVANGDITSPEKARWVQTYTGADGLMIGRAAQGNPWIFREIWHYLQTGQHLPPPTLAEAQAVLAQHLQHHHSFYGERTGVLTARKHLQWYVQGLQNCRPMERLPTSTHTMPTAIDLALQQSLEKLLQAPSTQDQVQALHDLFNTLSQLGASHFAPDLVANKHGPGYQPMAARPLRSAPISPLTPLQALAA